MYCNMELGFCQEKNHSPKVMLTIQIIIFFSLHYLYSKIVPFTFNVFFNWYCVFIACSNANKVCVISVESFHDVFKSS